MASQAIALGAAFAGRGIGSGQRIGLIAPNSFDWLRVFFGALRAGAVVVPFSTWSTRAELDFLLKDSEVRMVFSVPQFNDRDFEADLAAVADVETVILPRELQDFIAKAPVGLAVQSPQPADDAVVLYTSGSTSVPKGVRLKHGAGVENGFHIGERQGLVPGDRIFLLVPLFWSYGGLNALPAAFSHGAALVLEPKFEPGRALDVIEAEGCTSIYTLPAMTNALVQHPAFHPGRTTSLRTGMTIGSPSDFIAAAKTLGASEICNIYGTTETYGNCAVTWHHWPLERRAHCQGPLLPGQQMRFRDADTGKLLPAGAIGLVEVKGLVSPGYAGVSSELNAQVFTEDGFYQTGDIGRLDEQGNFVFVGRDAEMIKRAGINISPAEVEDVLCRAEGVAQAAVVGVAHAERGEIAVAFVVPARLATPTKESLIAHCRTLLSKYKWPDLIEFVDHLPTTATGKLQRKALKQQASALVAENVRPS